MKFALLNKIPTQMALASLAICLAAGGGASRLAAQQTPPSQPGSAATAPNADRARSDPADRRLMQQIRRSITSDRSLSTYAHNIKIIARDGKVTLRGPVRTEQEREAVVRKAADAAGADNVTDQLTIGTRGKSS